LVLKIFSPAAGFPGGASVNEAIAAEIDERDLPEVEIAVAFKRGDGGV
jgi:hypothetical protein